MKEVIKKQLENASKRKGGEKTQMMQMIPADTDVFKTSSDRLKKVMTSYDQTRRLHDVWKKTSDLRRLKDVLFKPSWRRLIYVVLKTSNLRRLEDVWSDLRQLEKVQFATFLKRLIYHVFGTSDLRHLEDVQFTTSWRRCRKRPIYNVLKTSVKRRLCSNVVATSI